MKIICILMCLKQQYSFGLCALTLLQVCQIASPDCLLISQIFFSRLRTKESFSLPHLERNPDLLNVSCKCSGFPQLSAP